MITIAMAMLLLGSTTNQPTYLECAFTSDAPVLDITTDEANSSVTLVNRTTGYVEKFPAAFTSTEVHFQSNLMSHTIDRTDLSISRTVKLLQTTTAGKCKVIPAPKRAF